MRGPIIAQDSRTDLTIDLTVVISRGIALARNLPVHHRARQHGIEHRPLPNLIRSPRQHRHHLSRGLVLDHDRVLRA